MLGKARIDEGTMTSNTNCLAKRFSHFALIGLPVVAGVAAFQGIVNSNACLMSKAKYRIVARLRLDYLSVTGLAGRRHGPAHEERTAYNVQTAG